MAMQQNLQQKPRLKEMWRAIFSGPRFGHALPPEMFRADCDCHNSNLIACVFVRLAKTSTPLGPAQRCHRERRTHRNKSLFASFSSEKEGLAYRAKP